MKVIGLLCGLSWYSTKIYYDVINNVIENELGDYNSAKIILNSINANDIIKLIKEKKSTEIINILSREVKRLEDAGADFIGLACNTIHAFLQEIEVTLNIPVINIINEVSKVALMHQYKKIGVLGTEFSIESNLYSNYLSQFGITTVNPALDDVKIMDEAIYDACRGKNFAQSRNYLNKIIDKLIHEEGAEAIILGCTELGLIVDRKDIRIFDSAKIHAERLAFFALENTHDYFSDQSFIIDKNGKFILNEGMSL